MGARPSPGFYPPKRPCAGGQAVWQRRRERCVGQRGKDLVQNDQRLLDFPRTHHEPCPGISAVFDGHVEMKPLVGIGRMVPAQVAIHAGRTSGHPDNPQISRGLLTENAGAINAIREGAGVHQQADQLVELLLEPMQVRAKRIARLAAAGRASRRQGRWSPAAVACRTTGPAAGRDLRAVPAPDSPAR